MNKVSRGELERDLPKKVGLIYSEARREFFPTEEQFMTESRALEEAELIGSYLEKLEIEAVLIPGVPERMVRMIEKEKPEMVFNLVGSINGQEYLASAVPGILEAMQVPYTGAGILGETLSYNKYLLKELLQSHGVPIPRCQLVHEPGVKLDPNMRFPLIAKLNEIHGAVEINKDAVSFEEKHLRERLKYLIGTYKQPVLVEEFIVGEEITAILLEGLNKKVYLARKVFKVGEEGFGFATFEDQWGEGVGYEYEKYQDSVLVDLVKVAFDVARMSDYAKFDVRVDQSRRYYFIDPNSNPAFGPKELDCAVANVLELYGVGFEEILKRMILNTMRDAKGMELLPVGS